MSRAPPSRAPRASRRPRRRARSRPAPERRRRPPCASDDRPRRGELDLALSYRASGLPVPAADLLERVHLLTDRMFAALPATHRLASRRAVHLADLHADGGAQPGARLIFDACVAAGFEPRIVAETDHAPITHGLVAAGVGVTLVPGISLGGVHGDVAIRPLAPPELTREIDAVVRAGRLRPPAVAAMLDLLRELAPRYAAAAP